VYFVVYTIFDVIRARRAATRERAKETAMSEDFFPRVSAR